MKTKSKILAVTGGFVPYNDTVTLLSYKHLRRSNQEVDVIALRCKEDPGIKKEIDNDQFYQKCHIEYIANYDDTVASMNNKNVIKGIYNIFKYIRSVIIKNRTNSYEYIYTSSLPAFTHLAGYFVKKKKKTKWIASFSDPLYKSPYKYDKETFKEYGMIAKLGFLIYIFIYMNGIYEKLAFKYADKLVFICEEQRDFMIANHSKLDKDKLLEKSCIIPLNYIDSWDMYKSLMKSSKKTNTKKRLVHMGRIYGLRDFTKTINSLKILKDNDPLLSDKFVIVQYGEFLKRYTDLISELEIEDLFELHDKVSYESAINVMREADGLLLVDTIVDDDTIQPYLPSKILEYMLTGKPIIAIANTNSPTRRILGSNGIETYNNCQSSITEAIESFIDGDLKVVKDKPVDNNAIVDLFRN